MPRVPRPRKIQRYFHPLMNRTSFSPERLLTPPPMIWNTCFVIEDRGTIPGPDIPLNGVLQAKVTSQHSPQSYERQEQRKKKKPDGEVARPKRGGFVLKDALEMEDPEYNAIQEFVRKLARDHLDCEKTITKQKQDALKIVYDKAKASHPILEDYEDDWPVYNMLKGLLSNTAHRSVKK